MEFEALRQIVHAACITPPGRVNRSGGSPRARCASPGPSESDLETPKLPATLPSLYRTAQVLLELVVRR
jgi:hypothetical protein